MTTSAAVIIMIIVVIIITTTTKRWERIKNNSSDNIFNKTMKKIRKREK